MNNNYLLEMKGISKKFPGVLALDNVGLQLERGTVHALMGENGAGKSTLMKILAGIYQADEGTIVYKDKEVWFQNPRDSQHHGISMIHQELSSLLDMTVGENIFLGREFHKGMAVDFKRLYNETKKLLNRVGLNIDPTVNMKELSISQMQMVEIAKAISYNSEIIIMDEPTSAISTKEAQTLFSIIRKLKEDGCCIIYITHKMEEVFQIADFITIFRDGHYIGSYAASAITIDEIIRKMVDRDLTEIFPGRTPPKRENEPVLKIENISRKGSFEGISFEVYAGEIVGLAGLMGAGRTEVVESIFGVRPVDSGQMYIDGKRVNIRKTKNAIRAGMGLVTEDRKLTGLVLSMNILDNITLALTPRLCSAGFILKKKLIKELCDKYSRLLKIKMSGPLQEVSSLSGGNQQKVVLGKWLMMDPKILIFDEPTRGIDVGAKSEFYRIISDLADAGVAVLFISSEMQEILGMCDRFIVMQEGRKKGEITRKEATQELLLKYATGTV